MCCDPKRKNTWVTGNMMTQSLHNCGLCRIRGNGDQRQCNLSRGKAGFPLNYKLQLPSANSGFFISEIINPETQEKVKPKLHKQYSQVYELYLEPF